MQGAAFNHNNKCHHQGFSFRPSFLPPSPSRRRAPWCHAGHVVLYWPERELELTLPPAAVLAGNKEAALCQRGVSLSLSPLGGVKGSEEEEGRFLREGRGVGRVKEGGDAVLKQCSCAPRPTPT